MCRCNGRCSDRLIPELEEYFARLGNAPFPARGERPSWTPDVELEVEGDFGLEGEVDRRSREYVRWVQRALNKHAAAFLAEDGVAGSSTRQAIARFQRAEGLTPDGIVGPQTEQALIAAGAGQPPAITTSAGGTGIALQGGTGTSGMVNAGGIVVAPQIASQVSALLQAAATDGVRLGGGGFRSPEQQIALRKKHCGPTDYDIWQKPSSQCAPMTARPGQSNHERGLAIDFTYNGQGINSHDNPGFQWLQANAHRFGLINLPKEPWHWSIDGR